MDGGWKTSAIESAGYRGHGYTFGGGLRGAVWMIEVLAITAQVRGHYSLDWTRDSDGETDGWHRRMSARGAASLMYGRRDGGAYGWLGAAQNLWGNEELVVKSKSLEWNIDPQLKTSLLFGGELHSSDLLGYGNPRHAYLSAGVEAQFITVSALAFWVGLAY